MAVNVEVAPLHSLPSTGLVTLLYRVTRPVEDRSGSGGSDVHLSHLNHLVQVAQM